MVRSIRSRLLIWYSLVLLVVIGGFAGVLYQQVRSYRLGQLDERLASAAQYLEATLRGLPPHELEGVPPPDGRRPPDGPGPRGPRPRPEGPPGPPPPREARLPRDEFAGPGPPPRPDRPPFGPDGPPPRLPGDLLRAAIDLPDSLLERPDDPPRDRPYFVIWRAGGGVLAESGDRDDIERVEPSEVGDRDLPLFRWQPAERREAILAGPRRTVILVGKPVGRTLGELRTFAWQMFGAGAVALAVGLAGGWLITRGITRPVAAISRTAAAISGADLSHRIDTSSIDRELLGLASVLNDTFARLQAAFERQSRFTADASHELRTPLAVIQSHVELALSKQRSSEEYRETLTACARASSRMAALVDGLLTLARADAGQLDRRFEAVDAAAIVEEVIEQYQPQAELGKIELVPSLAEGVMIEGDPTFVARITSNLLSNAIRHTPPGGRIGVQLSAQGREAALIIEDTGCGIPPEDQHLVFERFFRADKSRTTASGGNGLGLAICKSLVDAHHGRISFTSAPGRTRFEVRMPLAMDRGLSSRMVPPGDQPRLEHIQSP